MPPCAASNRPARALAPVYAPVSAPNSSLSSRSDGSAPDVDAHERAVAHARIRLDDLGDDFLADAVRPGDQHRHVGARDLRRHLHRRVHGTARVDHAAQVEACRQRRAQPLALAFPHPRLEQRDAQLQQVANRGHQPRVVPGLREVIGGAGLHEFDGGLEMRPRGEQDDREVGLQAPQRAEERDAFIARRRLAREVHVLDHEVDAAPGDPLEAGRGRTHALDPCAFQATAAPRAPSARPRCRRSPGSCGRA